MAKTAPEKFEVKTGEDLRRFFHDVKYAQREKLAELREKQLPVVYKRLRAYNDALTGRFAALLKTTLVEQTAQWNARETERGATLTNFAAELQTEKITERSLNQPEWLTERHVWDLHAQRGPRKDASSLTLDCKFETLGALPGSTFERPELLVHLRPAQYGNFNAVKLSVTQDEIVACNVEPILKKLSKWTEPVVTYLMKQLSNQMARREAASAATELRDQLVAALNLKLKDKADHYSEGVTERVTIPWGVETTTETALNGVTNTKFSLRSKVAHFTAVEAEFPAATDPKVAWEAVKRLALLHATSEQFVTTVEGMYWER